MARPRSSWLRGVLAGPLRPAGEVGAAAAGGAAPKGLLNFLSAAQRPYTRRVRLSCGHGTDDVDDAGRTSRCTATSRGTARQGGTPAPGRTFQQHEALPCAHVIPSPEGPLYVKKEQQGAYDGTQHRTHNTAG